MTDWEQLSKVTLLKLHEKLLKNSTSTILQSFGMWSKLERWKSSISGCLMSSPKIKKITIPKVSSSLILHNNNEPLLDRIVMYDKKLILYNWQQPGQWLDWAAAPKHFPKPDFHQKRSWSLFSGLLPVWYTAAFWILTKPLYLRSRLSKSKRCTKNYNTCSQHWSTEWAQFFSRTMLDYTPCNQHLLSCKDWAKSSASPTTVTWPTDYRFFKPFNNLCRESASTANRRQKSQRMDFYATGVNKLISHWQKCVDCNDSYFDE